MNVAVWIESPFGERLGWTLVHSLWQLALIAAGVAVLLAVFRTKARTRDAIAYAGLLLAAIVPMVAFGLHGTPAEDQPIAQPTVDAARYEPAEFVPPTVAKPPASIPEEMLADLGPVALEDLSESHALAPLSPSDRPTQGASRPVVEVMESQSAWLVPFWLAGVVVLSLRHLGGWLLARRVVRQAEPPARRAETHLVLAATEGGRNWLAGLLALLLVAAGWSLSNPAIQPEEVAAEEPVDTEPVDSLDEDTKVADEEAAGALEGRGSTRLATVFPNRQAMELTEVREVFVSEDGSEQTFRRWQPNGGEYRGSKEPPAGATGDRLVRQFLFRSAEVYFVTEDGVDVLKPVEIEYRADGAITMSEVINDGGRYGDGKVYQDSYVEARFDEPRKETDLYLKCTDGPETFRVEIHNVSLEPGYKTEPRIYSLDCLRRFGDARRRAWHCDAMDHISGMAYTRVYQQDDPPEELRRRALISMFGWKSLYAQAMPLAWPKITTEPIRRTVVTPTGEPVAGATVVSHTRRHWVRILEGGKLHDQPHGSATTTDARGKFGLPERKEHYRVLVLHDVGVASLSYEELLETQQIILRPWARVEGSVVFDGKPRVGETVLLRPDTQAWCYDRGGPRITVDYRTETDSQGRFVFEKVFPLPGRVYVRTPRGMLSHLTPYLGAHGETTTVDLGAGSSITGRLRYEGPGADRIDWSQWRVRLSHVERPMPTPPEAWRGWENQWHQRWRETAEGRRWMAEGEQRINQNYYAEIEADGTLMIGAVPRGEYLFYAATSAKPWKSLRHTTGTGKIVVDSPKAVDLGDVTIRLLEPEP